MYATRLPLACELYMAQLCKQAVQKGSEQQHEEEEFFWSAFVD